MPNIPRPTPSRLAHYVAPIKDASTAIDDVDIAGRPSSLWSDAWFDIRKRPMFWISSAVVLLVVVMAIWPGLFTSTPPANGCDLAQSNGGPTAGHPLGFTRQGCDIYSRIVHGARTSVSVGLISTFIGSSLGLVMGAIAGFYPGWLDSFLSRVGDIFFSIPYILAAVVVMSVFSQYRNVFTLSFAIGGFAWAATARVVRAEVLRVRQSDYITAARTVGRSQFGTLIRHAIPNAIAPLLVVSTLSLASAIVAESVLAFLGVGLGGDTMSWGRDISEAQVSLKVAPMALIWPSIALTVTVLAFIMLGELIRDALDPRARAER